MINNNPIIKVGCGEGTVAMGVVGNFNARQQVFDLSLWTRQLGEGTLIVSLLRPGDAAPYAVADVVVDGSTATWTFDDTDTAVGGWGKVFLTYRGDGFQDATTDYEVYIATNSAPDGEVPSGLDSWYQRMLEAAANAQIAAANAAASAEAAADSAQGARNAQQAVENLTVSAEALAAGSTPTVQKTLSEGVVNLEFGIPQGTKNYNDLDNQPQINGNTLDGNQTGAALGLVNAVAGKGLSTNDYTDADKAQLGTNTSVIAANTADIANNADAIAQIEDVIPPQASSNNQLADKQFVNSSIQTSTAHYRGSWATWAAVPTEASLYPQDDDGVTTPTSNDYLVVQDAADYPVEAGEDALVGTWRFKYSGLWAANGKNGWHPEYQVNEEPLTAAQIAAINSGITAAGVSQISTNQTTIQNHVADKQNPHEVTKAQVGLGNVDNTSDADKPVSTAAQAALDKKTGIDLGIIGASIGQGIKVSAVDGDGKPTAWESTDVAVFPVSISCVQYPAKVNYEVGDTFDPTGMVVVLNWSDGQTETLNNADLAIDPSIFGTVGTQPVTLTYSTKPYVLTTTITVMVSEIIPDTWQKIQQVVRAGTIGNYIEVGDQLVAAWNGTNRDWDVQGIDEACPAEAGLTHTLDLLAHPVLASITFDPAQYLYAVTAEAWPDGMPAGTYNIGYRTSTSAVTWWKFTTTLTIPVGGGIRVSAAPSAEATITTYAADTYTTLESGLALAEASGETDGTNIGTTTGNNPSLLSGDYINFVDRNLYGSNRWTTSYMRQYLNSDESPMAWEPATIWSRSPSTLPAGFLYGLDEGLKAVLGRVRVRYAKSISDGYGYEDVEDLVTLQTMLDMGFGNNNGIAEGPVDVNGTVKRTTAYSLWKDAAQADKIKYSGSSASSWWLSSTNPSNANDERNVNTSGALSYSSAHYSFGAVPSLHII